MKRDGARPGLQFIKTKPLEVAVEAQVQKSESEWRTQLTPQQYNVLRNLERAGGA
jgi:hypothetical protein